MLKKSDARTKCLKTKISGKYYVLSNECLDKLIFYVNCHTCM